MMNRREFFRGAAAVGAGATVAGMGVTSPAHGARRYRLRYGPRLDFMRQQWSVDRRLEFFAEHGFDATEYNGLTTHPISEVEAMRRTMDRVGIEMGIFVVRMDSWDETLCDPQYHDKFLQRLRQALDYHRVIGNKSCTVVPGNELQKVSRSIQRQHVIDALKKAADILEPTDLTIVIEPLNVLVNHPGVFVVESGQAWEIMNAVGSDHVKILFDIYHQQISEGNLINNIRQYYSQIGYFQVGDNPGRNEPGTGEVNWKNVFKAIFELGYTGILGMEHGLSVQGEAGLVKCFEAYAEADRWA